MAGGLPGGVIDPGESPVDAAKRELFEETGLRADGLTSIGTHALIYPGSGKHYLAHVFSAERVSGDLLVQMTDEISSARWYQLHNLPSPLTPSAEAVLRDLVGGGRP